MYRSHAGFELESTVASVLEQSKWNVLVEHDASGIMVDIWASKKDSGNLIVGCKAYRKLVGLRTARQFASTVRFLREKNQNLSAWLVTTSGFTANAQTALAHAKIRAYTLDGLLNEFKLTRGTIYSGCEKWNKEANKARSGKIRAFVITPLDAGMDDVFFLGILWATKKLKIVTKRSDTLEHNGEIIEGIRAAIGDYDIIIADTSGANPNVCYEVGFAHALKKYCVLACRKGNKLPFDLQGVNHLIYRNIIDLRELLRTELEENIKKIREQKTEELGDESY